jgi:hypothetical protein
MHGTLGPRFRFQSVVIISEHWSRGMSKDRAADLYCRSSPEIVCVKFRSSGVDVITACPNCAIASAEECGSAGSKSLSGIGASTDADRALRAALTEPGRSRRREAGLGLPPSIRACRALVKRRCCSVLWVG